MEPGKDILRYADAAMYDAQPILKEEGARVTPRVFLLNATRDPLGGLAADMRMYRGDPVYSLDEIDDETRRWAWGEVMKTALNTPLEGIQMKFMIEAVTRSFTHQMVRQRVGAYYVQESLRFAVKKGIAQESALPPSIIDYSNNDSEIGQSMHDPEGWQAWKVWDATVRGIEEAYDALIALGIPAEDARGLLPHCVTTRIIYTTNLRALFEHVANRLCTQAQFEWRMVILEMMKAIRNYMPEQLEFKSTTTMGQDRELIIWQEQRKERWQWQLIAEPHIRSFTPICYRQGTCALMSELDRGCTIRDRVLAFAEHGIPSTQWHIEGINWAKPMGSISPEEWLADPNAGRTTETNRPQ